ncbi:MAG: FAD-dependent oxidoreductase [Hyphomicrobiales bacterium]|nr:FAD-dependent oxidoreductase [Hyphomicrobiales bacterium]
MPLNDRIVIIGAGEAGVAAALELRARGHAGTITLLGAEAEAPYERPPLSKAFLMDDSMAPTPIGGAAGLETANIGVRRGCTALRLERASRQVIASDGTTHSYDQALIATGARARRLRLPGAGDVPVHYLRTMADAFTLRALVQPPARIGIIGAGFIGLELAASARKLGCEVTVFELAPRILARAVPEELAALIARRHVSEGVMLMTGVALVDVARAGAALQVTLADGRGFAFDHLIAGVGAEPETALAAEAGLAISNGIAVDERLQTSDPAIFAAGDCCAFLHARYDMARLRLESWRNAQAQGRHAAQAMTGVGTPFHALPWFWSDQYDLHLQICGLNLHKGVQVRRGTPGEGLILFDLDDAGRLTGASGLGTISQIGRDMRIAEMLVERAAVIDPSVLADSGRPLKALLRA